MDLKTAVVKKNPENLFLKMKDILSVLSFCNIQREIEMFSSS